ncbi:MAG: hypothetical protein KZQ99_01575 [Candidatus Thiodiazotropha sp. (ex Dulcina madagascariensis)]|nr:hypothetical protein [Candidatus Thiodiazotropha sp. (ex Dulcina madagascariensis)]
MSSGPVNTDNIEESGVCDVKEMCVIRYSRRAYLFIHKCNCYGAEKKVIIGFHNTPGPAEHAMIRGAGGKIKKRFKHLRAVSVDILDSDMDALRSNPDIAYIEEDALLQAMDPLMGGIGSLIAAQASCIEYENAWSVSHIGSQVPHDGGITGAGIKIAVLDTGIDWAVANQMDIINLSMGFTTRYQSLADACEAAHAAGLVVVAAAGNSYGGPVGGLPVRHSCGGNHDLRRYRLHVRGRPRNRADRDRAQRKFNHCLYSKAMR